MGGSLLDEQKRLQSLPKQGPDLHQVHGDPDVQFPVLSGDVGDSIGRRVSRDDSRCLFVVGGCSMKMILALN